MIPPLFRRCPECGYTRPSVWFTAVDEDGHRLVECPACGHRFEPIEGPWLK